MHVIGTAGHVDHGKPTLIPRPPIRIPREGGGSPPQPPFFPRKRESSRRGPVTS